MRNIWISVPILLVIIIGTIAVNYIWFTRSIAGVSLGAEIQTNASEHAALLIFDVQEGNTGSWSKNETYRKQSTAMIQRINQLIDEAEKTKIPVIYIRNTVSNYLINLFNNSLAAGTPGVDADRRLRIVNGYTIMGDKLDAFTNPQLDSILYENSVNRLYFTGLDPAGSINNTLLAAKNRNYRISLIDDAIISEHPAIKKRKFNEFAGLGCDVISCRECMAKGLK